MKKIICALFVSVMALSISQTAQAQNIKSYKVKTEANASERGQMLDALRNRIAKEYKQEVQFAVNTLNVQGDYAWFRGDVIRKDGKEFLANEYDDCCHVEGLLKKKNGKWQIDEMVAFSTDVWWEGLWQKKKLSQKLFID